MLEKLHLAHLTGTVTVHENRLCSDVVEFNRPRHSFGQMFFKPYESNKEFIFCARHTLHPLLLIGLGILDPIVAAIVPTVVVAASVGFLLISDMNTCIGNEGSASWWSDMADEIFSRLCQAVINLVVLPIAALALATRGISTGLKAADIYDYDAPKEDMPQTTVLA